jgi:uncharacterized protein
MPVLLDPLAGAPGFVPLPAAGPSGMIRGMTDLAHYIATTPLADTHEHTIREHEFLADPPDILQSLFAGGYIMEDLLVAGSAQAAVERLLNAKDSDIAARFAVVQEAWQHCRFTGYGEGTRLTAKLVFGLDELTPAALAEADPACRQLCRPGGRLHLLRDVANLAFVDIDLERWEDPRDPSGPDFFLRDLSWFSISSGQTDFAELERVTGVAVRDPESYRAALAGLFAEFGRWVVALKTQHAYTRTLAWQPRSDSDIAPLLQRRLAGATLTPAEQVVLGDWGMARGVELAGQHDLPFKIHTGYNAGHGYMDLHRVRPGLLCPLLAAYPQTRFVLMHTGYPFGDEMRALAKHYPNVYIDFCWAWAMDPPSTADFLRRTLHAVPVSKLFIFGGDVWYPVQAVGYAAQCRLWLTRALQAEVADGLLHEREACALAGRLMGANQRECFRLDARQALLREAAPPPSTGPRSEPER